MTLFMIAVVAVALGLVRLHRIAVPARPDMLAGVQRWERSRAVAANRQLRAAGAGLGPATAGGGSLLDRAGVQLAETLERRVRDLTALRRDLAITGFTLEVFVLRLLGLGLAGLLTPLVLSGVVGVVFGSAASLLVGLVLGMGLAATAVVLNIVELRANAKERRNELRAALSTYLDLVSMCLEAGRAPEEALPAAARIGSGWTFTALRDALDTAAWSRTTPAHQLGELGRRFGMNELVDLEGTLVLAWSNGTKVRASLAARAGTLREQRVADSEAEANRATSGMQLALFPMALTLVGYELFPALARLFTGS